NAATGGKIGEVSTGEIYLRLLGGFQLLHGAKPLLLSPTLQRLLAFLALQPNGVDRSRLSGALWPESTEKRANASLRSALCRVQGRATDVLWATNDRVSLGEKVSVDFRAASDIAGKVVVSNQ